MAEIKSALRTFRQISAQHRYYNIPRYQRLYVWNSDQVKKLLEDFLAAFTNRKPNYYLGAVLVIQSSKSEQQFDLIDGQQRFTTLWLLGLELGNAWSAFTHINGELRLRFSIRPRVIRYFESARCGQPDPETGDTSHDHSLQKIFQAREEIRKFLSKEFPDEHQRRNFALYLEGAVKMVITEVPSGIDLNKLFEAVNSRGVQLAHHEILKASLLSRITVKSERIKYAKIWNACSGMGNYLERNLNAEFDRNISLSYNFGEARYTISKLFDFLSGQSENTERKLTIARILTMNADELKNDEVTGEGEEHPDTTDEEKQNVRSLLSFPLLLIHTLRIYLCRNRMPDIDQISEKDLLGIFEEHTADFKGAKVKEFIHLLLDIRTAFDNYVIKWVEVKRKEEWHLIKQLYIINQKKGGQSWYLRRKSGETVSEIAMLQSMLYHSQQITTQHWLTPFLYFTLSNNNVQQQFDYLRRLDDFLFSSGQSDTKLMQRTYDCMNSALPQLRADYSILKEEKGTGFLHYWFYKVEFILWYQLRNKMGKDWQEYRLTAKNSVEHISPQNPRDPADRKCTDTLEKFGNLVLVTRSINSAYSDNPYGVKKSKFLDKKAKGSLDSLKSDLIYSQSDWNDNICDTHLEYVLNCLKDYFSRV